MFGLKDEELQEIKKILKACHIPKAVIFGSRAKGNYRKGSDVDLAVRGDEHKLSYLLNEESPLVYYFDVVNMDKINNEELLEHIERVGKEI